MIKTQNFSRSAGAQFSIVRFLTLTSLDTPLVNVKPNFHHTQTNLPKPWKKLNTIKHNNPLHHQNLPHQPQLNLDQTIKRVSSHGSFSISPISGTLVSPGPFSRSSPLLSLSYPTLCTTVTLVIEIIGDPLMRLCSCLSLFSLSSLSSACLIFRENMG